LIRGSLRGAVTNALTAAPTGYVAGVFAWTTNIISHLLSPRFLVKSYLAATAHSSALSCCRWPFRYIELLRRKTHLHASLRELGELIFDLTRLVGKRQILGSLTLRRLFLLVARLTCSPR
jgi:hypothetical protein